MIMPNLYGNVISNVCAGLVGGPGLVPGANYGRDYAVFETVGVGGFKDAVLSDFCRVENAYVLNQSFLFFFPFKLGFRPQGTQEKVLQTKTLQTQLPCC